MAYCDKLEEVREITRDERSEVWKFVDWQRDGLSYGYIYRREQETDSWSTWMPDKGSNNQRVGQTKVSTKESDKQWSKQPIFIPRHLSPDCPSRSSIECLAKPPQSRRKLYDNRCLCLLNLILQCEYARMPIGRRSGRYSWWKALLSFSLLLANYELFM